MASKLSAKRAEEILAAVRNATVPDLKGEWVNEWVRLCVMVCDSVRSYVIVCGSDRVMVVVG
jgi:hypothetical protein